jgi:hypothetical protein
MKMKRPLMLLMQGTECSSAMPTNELTVAISTDNYKFLPQNSSGDDLI